jgi:hypothetical protein
MPSTIRRTAVLSTTSFDRALDGVIDQALQRTPEDRVDQELQVLRGRGGVLDHLASPARLQPGRIRAGGEHELKTGQAPSRATGLLAGA